MSYDSTYQIEAGHHWHLLEEGTSTPEFVALLQEYRQATGVARTNSVPYLHALWIYYIAALVKGFGHIRLPE